MYSSLSAPILRVFYGNQLRIENLSANLGSQKYVTGLKNGAQLCNFHFCCSSIWGSTLGGNNLFLYSFKSRPHVGRPALSRETNRKTEKLYPLVKTLRPYLQVTKFVDRKWILNHLI